MKLASPLKYPGLFNDVDIFLTETGQCVVDCIKNRYPHISINKFYESCAKVEQVNLKDGLSSMQLLQFCKDNDISLYGFDVQRKCFVKHISKNRNEKALVYFCINEHMYNVIDNDLIKSLVETAKGIETNIHSILIENDERKNIFLDGLPMLENLSVEKIFDYYKCNQESFIVMYDNHSLNNLLVQFMNKNIVPKIVRSKKTIITELQYKFNKEHIVYLFADQNDKSQEINYRIVPKLCTDHEIKFKNQTLTTLIVQLREKFINDQNKRKIFTKQEREDFLCKNSVCERCEEKLTLKTLEIDHIIPLSAGGTNKENNLQALCSPCHKDKTRDEQLDDEHVKVSSTYSSFNEAVEKLMTTKLSQHLAFVEKMYTNDEIKTNKIKKVQSEIIYKNKRDKLGKSNNLCEICGEKEIRLDHLGYICEDCYEIYRNYKRDRDYVDDDYNNDDDYNDEYNMDINGCRRNQLYYNKNDIPLFTVMDQFKPYAGEDINIKGLYYVETNSYMPFRGNGLYYYPIIKLGLKEGIIKKENIKYVMIASLTTPHDYYNDFIDWITINIPDYAKLSINSMIGTFAAKVENVYWKSICITEDISEAYYNLLEYEGCFIDAKECERGPFY